MKSLEEARRQLERSEIKYRRAQRKNTKKWDDYTVATRKKKHQAFMNAIDAAIDNKKYKRKRDIHEFYAVQQKLHSSANIYLFDGDQEGKQYYERSILEFSKFLAAMHLKYPLSSNFTSRSNRWKEVKAKVEKDDKERERLHWIESFNLDKDLTYIKARNAAKREKKQLDEKAKKAQEQLAKEAREKAAEAERTRLGLNDAADLDLAIKLEQRATLEMNKAEKSYLYFKCWVLPDDSKWYKIGITNNPSRREAEQNILPVPANTLHIIALPSTNHARLAETAFHDVLNHAQIKNAGNRELFTLKPSQVQAVIAAMKQLDSLSSSLESQLAFDNF